MPYTNELYALKKRGILRKREVFYAESALKDFASNDYLGLSNRKKSLKKAYKLATNPKYFAPRASMLVNGYSALHKKLESSLSRLNGFESCILVGSGFLANIALIESLVRKGDMLFMDEEYHASGILASKLTQDAEFFKHNDSRDLEAKIRKALGLSEVRESCNLSANSSLQGKAEAIRQDSRDLQGDSNSASKDCSMALGGFSKFWLGDRTNGLSRSQNLLNPPNRIPKIEASKRIIIAIEGIYSMRGDIAPKDFARIALKYNAILIVDEAHSSGVLGENLNGYFDFHNIPIAPNFIKLGTFSKAYGSYGAYILSSNHIYCYLQTRAKPIIYSTALSAFDTALALVNLNFIHKNRARFAQKIAQIQKIIAKNLKIKVDSQIFSIQFQSQNEMLKIFRMLKNSGFLVGAIRTPSVKIPQLRIILSIKHKKEDIIKLCRLLKKHLKI